MSKKKKEATIPQLVTPISVAEKDYELLDKELNMELKKAHLTEKRLFLQEKQQQIEQMENRRQLNEERKTITEMVEVLSDAMRGHFIDDERTILGSEPFYSPIYDEIERGIIKKKVMSLLQQF